MSGDATKSHQWPQDLQVSPIHPFVPWMSLPQDTWMSPRTHRKPHGSPQDVQTLLGSTDVPKIHECPGHPQISLGPMNANRTRIYPWDLCHP